MGTILATALLAVTIITWMSRGLMNLNAPSFGTAPILIAPRGMFPNSRNSKSSTATAHANSRLAARRWTR